MDSTNIHRTSHGTHAKFRWYWEWLWSSLIYINLYIQLWPLVGLVSCPLNFLRWHWASSTSANADLGCGALSWTRPALKRMSERTNSSDLLLGLTKMKWHKFTYTACVLDFFFSGNDMSNYIDAFALFVSMSMSQYVHQHFTFSCTMCATHAYLRASGKKIQEDTRSMKENEAEWSRVASLANVASVASAVARLSSWRHGLGHPETCCDRTRVTFSALVLRSRFQARGLTKKVLAKYRARELQLEAEAESTFQHVANMFQRSSRSWKRRGVLNSSEFFFWPLGERSQALHSDKLKAYFDDHPDDKLALQRTGWP